MLAVGATGGRRSPPPSREARLAMAWRLRLEWLRELSSLVAKGMMVAGEGGDGDAAGPDPSYDVDLISEIGQAMDRDCEHDIDPEVTEWTARVRCWWLEALRCRSSGRE